MVLVDKSVGRSRLVVVEEGRRGFFDSVLRAAMGSVVTEGLSLGGGAVPPLGDALALVRMGLTM